MKSHGSGLWITGPRLAFNAWWTHDHGALWPLRGSEGHRDSSEIEIEREREEVVGVLTNGASWRRSYGDGHTMTLNRGRRWCSDGEMVLGARRRDWNWGGCNR
jgi:hypothetical protein